MQPPTLPESALDLRAVRVRPTRGAGEHRRRDRLVAQHHYLPFAGLFGRGFRHVATLDGAWLALPGWQAGALRVRVRDRWIGWPAERKLRRLHLIAHNARFVILPAAGPRRPNLASRVPGLSLRRLAADMRAAHGYPVLLAETFVDPARFAGTGYRAPNWRPPGRTAGYARRPGPVPRWRHHGQPKEVFVYEMEPDARARLGREAAEPDWQGEPQGAPPPPNVLRSLFDFLSTVPEFRKARGQRYPLATRLVLAVAGRLAGYRGVTAFAQFAARLNQEQRAAAGCFFSPSRQCYTAPNSTTFHTVLSRLPAETLEDALSSWSAQIEPEADEKADSGKQETKKDAPEPAEEAPSASAVPAVAMDGKDIRGASKQTEDGRRMLVAAVDHASGVVLRQTEVDSKSNEIPAVRKLAGELDLEGKVVTLDAMHARQETARCLTQECQADYMITAIKGNQPTIEQDLQAMDFTACPACETHDKGHGRIERRHYAAKHISAPEWDGCADLHGRRTAVRIERERHTLKTGQTTITVSYALTSLPLDRAPVEEPGAMIRNHRGIENRLHCVRDWSYDEDRCRAHISQIPHNPAALSNAAISIVRCCGSRFPSVPNAHRHFSARAGEAPDLVLNPLGT